MSTEQSSIRSRTHALVHRGPDSFRVLAVGGILVMTASYVSVLREVTMVVGGTQSLSLIVLASLAAATVLARFIRPRTAITLAVIVAVLGIAYYLHAVGIVLDDLLERQEELVMDTIVMMSGLPILRLVEVDIWTLGFAPAPVFLSWYLALRRQYALSVVPGGAALLFLVLTGDAGVSVTLLGIIGGLAAVGFGELERHGGSVAHADVLAILFAAMLVTSMFVTVVPGGEASPMAFGGGGGSDAVTLEGTVASSPDRSPISGSVALSAEVRFTIQSEQQSYWRTGVYDRFTGDEWVRSGQRTHLSDAELDPPPGDHTMVSQHVTVETASTVQPTVPEPMSVDNQTEQFTTVSDQGQFHTESRLLQGDEFSVESAVIDPAAGDLQTAGTDYPRIVTDRYLQQPEDLSDAFYDYTADVTADADNPYQKAVLIEDYLRTSKGYSLNVQRPQGNVAEDFLFDMDQGYCVYFATTMVQMLRAEDVPARYVTGYTSGEQVDDDRWVVRGLDAHAWVEVYFPGHGWVPFEPTPSDPRDDIHGDELDEARAAGVPNVDTEDTIEDGDDLIEETNDEEEQEEDTVEDEDFDLDEEREEILEDENQSTDDANETHVAFNESAFDFNPDPGGSDEPDEWYRTLLSAELIGASLVLLGGVAAAIHRTTASITARRRVRLYWHGVRSSPNRDVERSYNRLETLVTLEYRPRRQGESPRQYLSAYETANNERADPRLHTVIRRYERARYGSGVDRPAADDTISVVNELVRERIPILGHFVRTDRSTVSQ